jgi:hypothetical protein
MPFGLGFGEAIVLLLFLAVGALPLIAAVWALRSLTRLRSGQQELLMRVASIERQLNLRP